MITPRQFAYALLFLFSGFAGSFYLETAGWRATALFVLLIGCAGPLGIVTFRQLVALAPPRKFWAWGRLAMMFAVCAAGVFFAAGYGVYTKVHGEGILLIENDTLTLVRVPSTGRLIAVHVKQGDQVKPGDLIGEISKDELKDAIHEAESMLGDLQRQDTELAQIEEKDRKNKEAAMARLKQDIDRAQNDSSEKMKMAQREAELQQDQTNAEISRRRAQLERRLKIRQLETKLGLDRDKLLRTSRIVSHTRGQVAEVLSASGELVKEGAPVVVLHAPRAQRGTDDSEPPYDALVFVPAGAGKKIVHFDPVEVVPATVEREVHGFIRGHVTGIGELPANKLTVEEALGDPELADEFLKQYPREGVLLVKVKLEDRANLGREGRWSGLANRFTWSTATGAGRRLKTGTMCQAAIVIERRRLITLIIPWSGRIVGVN